ncbi:MAG TPA: phage tail sheath subtilisin-like domain-containing protein [Bryobacteraceae bacterium]|nr:phage tail sheath subtilisin-like domain-containing protein [Bryobacteraceae bacterium]
MPEYLAPGIYVEEVAFQSHAIPGVSTSTAGFVGLAREVSAAAIAVSSFSEFEQKTGNSVTGYLSYAVKGFFENGGKQCSAVTITSEQAIDDGLKLLDGADVSIVACPDEHSLKDAAAKIVQHCEQRKDRFAILQSPPEPPAAASHQPPVASSYAAYYSPWLQVAGLSGAPVATVPPCGHIAGVYARMDSEHGVFRAPSGVQILGAHGLQQNVTENDAMQLNERGINSLRAFPGRGILVWGARTTSPDWEWKYISVRRLIVYIEQSLQQGLGWTVFEPGGPPVWQAVVRDVQNFLLGLWRSGGLVGTTPDQSYFVRCDHTTMTQADVDAGRLVMVVGIAPVRPAEFVIIRITSQSAKQSTDG